MRIFGWAADDQGCGYYRLGLPLSELGKRGHDTSVSIVLTGAEKTADVVVGQRVCNDGPTRWWQRTAALPTGERPVLVYELDDDLFGIHPENDMSYGYFQDQRRIENIVRNMLVSDAITVSTDYLGIVVRARLGQHGPVPPVHVIPNVVDESILISQRPWHQEFILGWAGSGTHRPDFKEAGPQVSRFLRRNPSVVWHSIGGDFLPGDLPRKEHTGWIKGVEEYYRAVDFTVGIAPLADHPFNLSKSPIKAIEYGAMGIPIVASNVGPYADFVVHGETGFLVDREHEWGTYLHRLLTRPAERAKMGELARRRAAVHTVQLQHTVWERTYEEVLNAVQ